MKPVWKVVFYLLPERSVFGQYISASDHEAIDFAERFRRNCSTLGIRLDYSLSEV